MSHDTTTPDTTTDATTEATPHTATYDPTDDKVRVYPAYRLPQDEYARVKAAGFQWAPKQECFYAVWTPEREDLAERMAGSIEDETTTPAERAEARAARFQQYHERRQRDAERARAAVHTIADMIPFGQPILVGHHSEKRARRDAERIRAGMTRAVRLWDTSKYWRGRAAAVKQHAARLERPDVRYRRIKGLESDLRKFERTMAEAALWLQRWARLTYTPPKDGGPLTPEHIYRRAVAFVNHDNVRFFQTPGDPGTITSLYSALTATPPTITPEEARHRAIRAHGSTYYRAFRWRQHTQNRIDFERAQLDDAGGIVAEQLAYPLAVGGRVLVGRNWETILKINRKDNRTISVTTTRQYVPVVGIERIAGYEPPTAAQADAAKAATKLPPMVNVDEPDAVRVTQAEYSQMVKHGAAGGRQFAATEHRGRYRQRITYRGGKLRPVFVTDAKVTPYPPTPTADEAADRRQTLDAIAPEPDVAAHWNDHARATERHEIREARAAEDAPFEALREAARKGVQPVAAPHLWPTPAPLARRLVNLAQIEPGHRVLEPSAGTGNIAAAVVTGSQGSLLCVEVNAALAHSLEQRGYPNECADFLAWNTDGAQMFDRVVMNPPFDHGADIAHIQHAYAMLRPGGRLVAICANGPKQQQAFTTLPHCHRFEPLPEGTFDGTNVRAAIVELVKPGAPQPELTAQPADLFALMERA